MHKYIEIQPAESICVCVYGFKADHFAVDNPSRGSFLAKANSPSPAVVSCL